VRFRSLINPANISLIVLGGASTLLYIHALSIEGEGANEIPWFIRLALIQGLIYLAACLIVWRARPARSTLLLVVVFAALFRLSVLFAPPLLSDDVYRYVWDGRVQAAGINPFRYIPADQKLQDLRDAAIYPKINRRDYAPTMYPPGAELVFLLTTRISESVTWMKATMVGFEAVTLLAIMALLASFGLPRQRVLVYAWHPLVVWEFAGSGHLDAIALAFIALALLARRRKLDGVTGLLLGCATLIKLFPAILFPALYRRWNWRMPVVFLATTLLAYVPYMAVGAERVLGYLPGYMNEEGMTNGDRYFILALARRLFGGFQIPRAAFFGFAICVLLAIAIASLRDDGQSELSFTHRVLSFSHRGLSFTHRGLAFAAAFTVLLSPRYPWYFSWLVPFLCFVPALYGFYLTLASFILYALWLNGGPESLFKIDSALYSPAAFIAVCGWLTVVARRPGGARLPSPAEIPASPIASSELASLPGRISVVIPCLNEEDTIAELIEGVRRERASEVIVVDNDSRDSTAQRAQGAGARVIHEPQRGYGRACFAGFQACAADSDVVVFMDGDGSDCPEFIWRLVDPILKGTHDFVISSRLRGRREPGSMYSTQVIAGHLIGFILNILYGVRYTDMGPFRAIRRTSLEDLGMREMTYGWPLEMQMRAAQARLRILEVPVDYRRRNGGRSKVSGTLTGTALATIRILWTLVRLALASPR
jgi:hypothetical protein